MADGFGDNVAAKASEETNYYVNSTNGAVCDEEAGKDNILTITSTVGSFQLTQASRLTAQGIATAKLHGTVVDWGCGGGVLALLAACQLEVDRVVGLDYDAQNIDTCVQNAHQNGLHAKTEFYRSDSFQPFEDQHLISSLKGEIDFLVANPPASSDDDGFSFRRRIMKEALPFLKPNAQVLLQALSYYGPHRMVEAANEATDLWNEDSSKSPMELTYQGVVKSSPWIELGAGPGGYDFKEQIQQYCREERRGGMRYFCGPRGNHDDSKAVQEEQLTALEAMALWEKEGKTPICQWHLHALHWSPKK